MQFKNMEISVFILLSSPVPISTLGPFLSQLTKRADSLLSFASDFLPITIFVSICMQCQLVYQRFIYNFSNTFPLHLILSLMVWTAESLGIGYSTVYSYSIANKWGTVCIWIYLFIIRKAHGHAWMDYFLKV